MNQFDEVNSKKLQLVLFSDVIEHIIRISRIIRQPNGHTSLLGVGRSGRQSLTRLTASISKFSVIQPGITKIYGTVKWLTSIRDTMKKAGLKEVQTIFLISDV